MKCFGYPFDGVRNVLSPLTTGDCCQNWPIIVFFAPSSDDRAGLALFRTNRGKQGDTGIENGFCHVGRGKSKTLAEDLVEQQLAGFGLVAADGELELHDLFLALDLDDLAMSDYDIERALDWLVTTPAGAMVVDFKGEEPVPPATENLQLALYGLQAIYSSDPAVARTVAPASTSRSAATSASARRSSSPSKRAGRTRLRTPSCAA